ADHRIEDRIGIWQPRQIGGREADALALQPGMGPLQHLMGKVEGGELGIGVGFAKKEFRIAAIAAAGVEDVFAHADVEAAGPDQAPCQGFMAGKEARGGGERAGQAAIKVLDYFAVVYRCSRRSSRFLWHGSGFLWLAAVRSTARDRIYPCLLPARGRQSLAVL